MKLIQGAVVALMALGAASGAQAQSGAQDFYRGKTITFIIGYGPGGGVDTASRIIARHLPRFIPGKPEIVPQNMEGAGGIVAGNHLGSRASRDGLTIGLPGRSWFVEGMVKSPGATFDVTKLSWIGSTGTNNTMLWVRGDLNIHSPAELKKYPNPIPTAGIGTGTPTVTVPNMLAEYGYPLKTVLGYNSSNRSLMALEQGEVGAYFTPEDSFAKRPDLVEKKIVVPIIQSKPMLKGVAVLKDLVPAKDQPVLNLFMAYDLTGLMLVAPPDVPKERLDILRKAFLEMCKDPEYQADAKRIGEPSGSPIAGAEIETIIAKLNASATPAVVEEYRRLGKRK